MNGAIKLLSRIFQMLKNLKILENNKQKLLVSKILEEKFRIFKKRNICERSGVSGVSGIYVQNFKPISWKMTNLRHFEG